MVEGKDRTVEISDSDVDWGYSQGNSMKSAAVRPAKWSNGYRPFCVGSASIPIG